MAQKNLKDPAAVERRRRERTAARTAERDAVRRVQQQLEREKQKASMISPREDMKISLYGEETHYANVDYAAKRLAGLVGVVAGQKEFEGMDLAGDFDEVKGRKVLTLTAQSTGNQATVTVEMVDGERQVNVLLATMSGDEVLLSHHSHRFGHRMVREVAKTVLRLLQRTPESFGR